MKNATKTKMREMVSDNEAMIMLEANGYATLRILNKRILMEN